MPIYNPPTPASIGAVPTSRQVIAGANMTGGGSLNENVTLNSTGGGGGAGFFTTAIPVKQSGTFISNNFNASAIVAFSSGTNQLDYAPFCPGQSITITAIAMLVNSGTVGALFKVGVYTSLTDGTPDALVAGSGSTDLSGASGGVQNFAFSAPITLNAGSLYWLALHQAIVCSIGGFAIGNINGFASASNVLSFYTVMREARSYALGLPANADGLTPTSTAVPAFRLTLQ